MLLLNRKSELKLKWGKSYFLSAVGAGNNDANSSNIIYTKSLLSFYLQKVIRNYQNFLVKDLKGHLLA